MDREIKKLREEIQTLKHSSETRILTLDQENRRLKIEMAQLVKQREDDALKGMAQLRFKTISSKKNYR